MTYNALFQNNDLISELYLNYSIYFPKCYLYFIKDNAVPNNKYLLVSEEGLTFYNSNESVTIRDVKDISNCWVRLGYNQTELNYIINFFKHVMKLSNLSEDSLERLYNAI